MCAVGAAVCAISVTAFDHNVKTFELPQLLSHRGLAESGSPGQLAHMDLNLMEAEKNTKDPGTHT